jgi:hypothetical protein
LFLLFFLDVFNPFWLTTDFVAQSKLKMDPVKEISELKEKRARLEHLLEVPGIDKDKDLGIRQQLIAIDTQITELWKHLPPPIDSRNVFSRGWDEMKSEPVQVGAPAVAGFCASLYTVGYFYTPIRHTYAPYTQGQMGRRERIFPKVFEGCRVPSAATKTIALSAFLLALKGWTNNRRSYTSRYS